MNARECFEIWAPGESVWSRWAKPVLFANLTAIAEEAALADLPVLTPEWVAGPGRAAVVDVPGPEAVALGLALARAGYRPVPLFNSAPAPGSGLSAVALIETAASSEWLARGAVLLRQVPLSPKAPPAFLIDSRRQGAPRPEPGRFDNRWLVFPQDFPSAGFLKEQGIASVLLIHDRGEAQPREDLAHVLLRWQEGGIAVWLVERALSAAPALIQVARPGRFKSLWYRVLALMGLRRNSAGGFGGIVPHPSSG